MGTVITCIEKDCRRVTSDHYGNRCRECHEQWVRRQTKHELPYYEQNNGKGPRAREIWQ